MHGFVKKSTKTPRHDDFFAVPPRAPFGQHPKLGSLHASMMRAAQAAYQAVTGEG